MMIKQKTIKDCVNEAKQAFDLALDCIKADSRYKTEFHYTWPAAIADIAMRRYTSNDIELAKAGISRTGNGSGSSNVPSSGTHSCSKCNNTISKNVFDYSMDRFNKPLCMDCQKQE